MIQQSKTTCTAFAGARQIATGALGVVALKAQQAALNDPFSQVLIFDDLSAKLIEVDFRGTPGSLASRIAQSETDAAQNTDAASPGGSARGPGRPKLGVVAREVTLLPRHWDWLANQPGGASVALRKLVEEARRSNQGADRVRQAKESAYRFMSAMAGNEPGFEEATRALFSGNRERFLTLVESWPVDVGSHAGKLASPAFEGTDERGSASDPGFAAALA